MPRIVSFPKWVDDHDDPVERAKSRLTYIIRNVLSAHGLTSIRQLSKMCKINNSSLSKGMRQGQIGDSLAVRIEDHAGYDNDGNLVVTHRDLRFPLAVDCEFN